MARKVRFENLTVEDVKSKLDKLDDPLIDFPLLKFVRFSIEYLKYLISTDNGCRGVKQEKGNVHALNASFNAGGWDLLKWPFPSVSDSRHAGKAHERERHDAGRNQCNCRSTKRRRYVSGLQALANRGKQDQN